MSVTSVAWKNHLKKLRLEPGAEWIEVPRSACVTAGDTVFSSGDALWLPCIDGVCTILPSYEVPVTIQLGALTISALIKEITAPEEYAAYKNLASLHYRGHTIHGRTARLVIRTLDPCYPTVLGFIELATPFFMNKARGRVLNAPFNYNGVQWQSWDIHAIRTHIHRIVRIARTVIAPEFRGFGLGTLLVQHAAHFARSRWQVAGKKPYFLEISADMLKFIPFVQRSGMQYVGQTTGNLHRVARDMKYLIQRFGDGQEDTTAFEQISGILDQQVSRMKQAIRLMRANDLNADQLVRKLNRLSTHSILKDFDLFRGIASLPKPTFMMGLNDYSEAFLRHRLREIQLEEPVYTPNFSINKMETPLRISDLSISYVSRVRRTFATHAIQQAFDISPADIHTNAIERLSFELQPGDILLIEGPSGSGKTTLLEAIAGREHHDSARVTGAIERSSNFQPYTCAPILSRKSLIETLGSESVTQGLSLLGLAGLSEPFLYLKRFEELSKGQQYRAMLAFMLASGSNVWIADEFCANLDEVTANLVAHNIQRTARKYGLTVVVAASNPRPFVNALMPDQIVRLGSSFESKVFQGVEYLRAMQHSPQLLLGVDPQRSAALLSFSEDQTDAVCQSLQPFNEPGRTPPPSIEGASTVVIDCKETPSGGPAKIERDEQQSPIFSLALGSGPSSISSHDNQPRAKVHRSGREMAS